MHCAGTPFIHIISVFRVRNPIADTKNRMADTNFSPDPRPTSQIHMKNFRDLPHQDHIKKPGRVV